jgi:uroporphyrinogen decarboxylase
MINSRERVLTALNHEEPDVVPIDMGSTENTTLCELAYLNLREYLGLEPDQDPYVINLMMGSVFPKEDLLLHYKIDFRPIRPSSTYIPKIEKLPDGDFYDEYRIRWRKAGFYYDMVEHPLKNFDYAGISSFQFPDPDDPKRRAGLKDQAKFLNEETDFAISVGHIAMGPFEMSGNLRSYEKFLTDIYCEPKIANKLLDKSLESAIEFWQVYLEEVGDYVQVVCQGDDLGTQIGPWISPKMYREWIKPRHKKLFDFIRTKTNAKIFLHSCGSVYDLIPDLIEAGVEILSPVQRSAAKMDLRKLKKDFGNDICFWGGGIDTQYFLPNASVLEIQDHVKETIDIMAPGGGYVFVPVHNIQSNIEPDKIDAIYQTAMKYGRK